MNGFEAKLYFSATPLAGAPSTGTWTELSIIKDVTLNDELEETDVTTRSGGGRKATDVGLRDNSVDLEIEWKPGDSGFNALFNAYKGRNPVAIAVMDGDIATAGKTGVAGNHLPSVPGTLTLPAPTDVKNGVVYGVGGTGSLGSLAAGGNHGRVIGG